MSKRNRFSDTHRYAPTHDPDALHAKRLRGVAADLEGDEDWLRVPISKFYQYFFHTLQEHGGPAPTPEEIIDEAQAMLNDGAQPKYFLDDE